MPYRIFQDRKEAGRLLAEELLEYGGKSDVVILALPRGGVEVGFAMSNILKLPLDIFVVRKIGVPWQEELAMGAIASGGIQVLNQSVINSLNIDEETIREVTARELLELHRRENLYRKDLPALSLTNKTIILVDDGIATGSTMRAAVAAIRKLAPKELIVAVPVAPPYVYEEMKKIADRVVVLMTPEEFYGVGQWYENFNQLSDWEVCAMLRESRKETPGKGHEVLTN
ncbi:phosphoribosyl transferase [Methylacidiphilum kamchatkense Kam1]|uniref:Phosphoribosyl transferase n=1 Tax=Methylacidiphilum kamchatkense Kam1 TaxID=1202785 RepID=A0A0C1USR0_9BACT|nr:phosphoribosyltransferase [Methylacidiphilum kamchatkense]KIE58818.1 phosphoribosyl transferase [Methylacidiphilum kamchatkense Kam1]QDQ41769.1 putative phosphoribosyltransferase [Methylacidiphilum kamchatkense Kam1]